MNLNIKNTEHAPAEKEGRQKLIEQNQHFSQNQLLVNLVNSISQMLVVLNSRRQIIYANNSFCNFLGVSDKRTLLGKRPGEAVNCFHVLNSTCGCGTTKFCIYCGAVNSILESQKGERSTKECRILRQDYTALELRVTSSPLKMGEENFTIFAISDMRAEKKNEKLENFIFNDFMHNAGIISSLSGILGEFHDIDEFITAASVLRQSVEDLIEDIKSQQLFFKAEANELELKEHEGKSRDLLQQIQEQYSGHELSYGKKIVVPPEAENIDFISDISILRRVLICMLVNALEASAPGAEITISSAGLDDKVRFSVHNNGFMPTNVRYQIFKRSFTTKGEGRGRGTYSMKLYGEKYLKGKVWFESNKKSGTTFYIELLKEN